MSTNILCVNKKDATLSISLGDGIYLEITAFDDGAYLIILDPGFGIEDMVFSFVSVDTLLSIINSL